MHSKNVKNPQPLVVSAHLFVSLHSNDPLQDHIEPMLHVQSGKSPNSPPPATFDEFSVM